VQPPRHPLAELIVDAVAGRFVAADGGWHRVPPWRRGLEAVVGLTGHAVLALASDIANERLVGLGVDGFGGAHDPRLISALAGPRGWIDSLDALLVGRGTADDGPHRLVERPDLALHPRVQFAARIRDEPRVLGYPDADRSAVVIVGRGVAGLTELSFELEPDRRGVGGGSALVSAALATVESGELVVAAVAPGNAASLRALLSAGFVPVGSSQLFRRGG
jgi:GNAT superfamily N-acetyltransferase